MVDAYKKVMMSEREAKLIKQSALNMRVNRFFGTYRMREAMAATEGKRGETARKLFEKWRQKHSEENIKRFAGEDGLRRMKYFVPCTDEEADNEAERERIREELEQKAKAELEQQKEALEQEYEARYQDRVARDKEKWIQSLNINATPDSMTVYGTGQFLAYVAVKEIMARQNELKRQGISVLDKNGSALTPTIISALKTAASMILPFAPAPNTEERQQMTKAAVLLGLMPDSIEEDPDDYTAPAPVAIDVGEDN